MLFLFQKVTSISIKQPWTLHKEFWSELINKVQRSFQIRLHDSTYSVMLCYQQNKVIHKGSTKVHMNNQFYALTYWDTFLVTNIDINTWQWYCKYFFTQCLQTPDKHLGLVIIYTYYFIKKWNKNDNIDTNWIE